MNARCGLAFSVAVALALSVSDAGAQPGGMPRRPPFPTSPFPTPPRPPPSAPSPPQPSPFSSPEATTDLRAHFGVDLASRLLGSASADERLRGIARASAIGTPEALALLVTRATDPNFSSLRADPRALIELARGLARSAIDEKVRLALVQIVNTPTPALAGRLALPRASTDAPEDGDPVARLGLAREIAALALAQAGDTRSVDLLTGIARGGGSGQSSAALALAAYPPSVATLTGIGIVPAPALKLLSEIGDLRTLDTVRASARASDSQTRAAAILALGQMGDSRATEIARSGLTEKDARVRAASAEALVLVDAPDKLKAIESLIADDATAIAGARLAERARNDSILKALAARATVHPDPALRAAAIRALGRAPEPFAASSLAALLGDPLVQSDAAQALARSPSESAMKRIASMLSSRPLRRMGMRAYVVRALVRGERDSGAEQAIESASSSEDVKDRALATFVQVALGERDPAVGLADRDPRVRRAAGLGALAVPTAATRRALLARFVLETDVATQQVLAVGLEGGDPEGRVTTLALVDRAGSGGPDAPLAALALAGRTDAVHDEKVGALLASKDPLIRAHVARGLAMSAARDALGLLASAYAYETEATVRRAIVQAVIRLSTSSTPLRDETLRLAARLDPDGMTRFIAARAISGATSPVRAADTLEVAWLRLTAEGGAPPAAGFTGALVRSDGVAVPIAFDDDGFALVPGVPPGDARLVLAPRVPSYEAPSQ